MLTATRVPGRQRRRRAIRRPGEGPADHRLGAAAFGLDWVRPPRQMIRPARTCTPTSPLRQLRRREPRRAATGKLAGMGTAEVHRVGAHGLDAVVPQPSNRNPLDSLTRPRPRANLWATTSSTSSKSGDLRFACEDPDAPENCPAGADHVASQPARLQRQGQRVLPQAPAGHRLLRCGPTRRPSTGDRATSSGTTRPPRGSSTCCCTLDFRHDQHDDLLSDVVLPAATWYEKHDLNTTDMHPFIHSFNPAIAPPWQTRTDWDAWQAIAHEVQRPLATEHLGVRRGRRGRAAAARHRRRDGDTRTASSSDWKKGECEPVPGMTMPKLVVVERDYGAVAAKMVGARPADGEARRHHQGRSPTTSAATIDYLRGEERRDPGRAGRRPAVA